MNEPIQTLAGRCLCWAVLLVVAGSQTLAAEKAAPPAANAERIAELVKQLGSDEFTIRESATEALTQIGLPAFAALEAAGKNPDREIRYRSQRILGLIRQLDMQRRLEAFLAGKDEGEGYQLPGWDRFKKTYGDEPQSRTLFVEMQRADAELLRSLEEGPRSAAEMIVLRAPRHHVQKKACTQPNKTATTCAWRARTGSESSRGLIRPSSSLSTRPARRPI
jgi:hypothetical protein